MNTHRHCIANQKGQGFSLVEMMIAITLASFLLIGLIQIFAGSKAAYRLSEGLSRSQENGRFALEFMQRDIRMAGHFGCVNQQALMQSGARSMNLLFAPFAAPGTRSLASYDAIAQRSLHFHAAPLGYEYVGSANPTGPGNSINVNETPGISSNANDWSPALPAELLGRVVPGSDVVFLHYLSADGVPANAISSGTIQFNPANWALLRGDLDTPGLFGVSQCGSGGVATVFQATSVDAATGTITISPSVVGGAANGLNQSGMVTALEQYPPQQTTLYRAMSIAYYVGVGAGGGPSLFRIAFDSTPGTAVVTANVDEVVEGVDTLQVLYGSSNPAAPTAMRNLRTADAVDAANDWPRVGLMQIGLLLRSPERASVEQRALSPMVLGVTVNPPSDGRIRTAYEATIAIRNQLFGD
ncbi:MAG: PilW family protein [Xanthomonadaceae bacterium]|nr:PilW family protein [Xanthomonadaceae bacterium]MDP2186602.1 PilW family protein [Xanthomonadales bacterium]MDZ4115657.1 PilW family protein [Xanthomonadaceae bacterium]MDZ4378502.1 PilW family protein [Xanthomonadaceae bacterium]